MNSSKLAGHVTPAVQATNIVKSVTVLAEELAEIERRFPSNYNDKDDPTPDPLLWHGQSPFFPLDSDVGCNCGCKQIIVINWHYNKLVEARIIAGIPFEISSWNRCRLYNNSVGGSTTSSHRTGYATDIQEYSDQRKMVILKALLKVGFTRIGVYNWGLHVDSDPSKTPDSLWRGNT